LTLRHLADPKPPAGVELNMPCVEEETSKDLVQWDEDAPSVIDPETECERYRGYGRAPTSTRSVRFTE